MLLVAILSGKGGVAKTTTVLALAAALHERGLRVDVVDLDPQGGLTWAAGLDPNDLGPAAGIVAVIEGRAIEAARVRGSEGFGIFPASPALAGLEARIAPALERFRDLTVDVVLFDTPPGVGRISQVAARVADRVVVPTNLEPAATHTLPHVLALLEVLGAEKKLAGLILTEVPPRTLLTAAQRDEVAAVATVLGEVPRSIAVAESVNAGLSVLGYAPKSAAAKAYSEIAAALVPGKK